MTIKPEKTVDAAKFVEKVAGGPLTFARLFKSIRQGEELTQEEFGKMVNLSKQKVCDIEKGRVLPSPSKAAEYAKVLGYLPESFAKLVIEEQILQAGLKLKVVDAA